MTTKHTLIAIFKTHEDAEAAVNDLKSTGHDLRRMSILGRAHHADDHTVAVYHTGNRMKHWGKLGGFWGAVWGLFIGAGLFAIPGVGPIAAAGPIVDLVVGALGTSAALAGLGAIGGALLSLGVPRSSAETCEAALAQGKVLLVAHGTSKKLADTQQQLQAGGKAESIELCA
jgi:hypothetical protein